MHTSFLLQTLSVSVVGFLVIVLLVVALIALRRERIYDEPLWGFTPLVLVVLGICTFVALMTAYAQTASVVELQRISERLPIV